MDDLISRQDAIEAVAELASSMSVCISVDECHGMKRMQGMAVRALDDLPSAQPQSTMGQVAEAVQSTKDCISRQAAIDALHMHLMYRMGTDSNKKRLDDWINGLPSAQPERTCVNCGRTVNNGGWYADGGTRCPIEEHYALPKDGYCHLWEKRNVTDDDYPERREE